MRDLAEIRSNPLPRYPIIRADEANILEWETLLQPTLAPFDKGAFWVHLSFPSQFPFVPPKVQFKTKIYHPSVDDEGRICLQIIRQEHWKPDIKVARILEELADSIDDIQAEHALRVDLVQEFLKERAKFDKNANEFIQKFAEKRV